MLLSQELSDETLLNVHFLKCDTWWKNETQEIVEQHKRTTTNLIFVQIICWQNSSGTPLRWTPSVETKDLNNYCFGPNKLKTATDEKRRN